MHASEHLKQACASQQRANLCKDDVQGGTLIFAPMSFCVKRGIVEAMHLVSTSAAHSLHSLQFVPCACRPRNRSRFLFHRLQISRAASLLFTSLNVIETVKSASVILSCRHCLSAVDMGPFMCCTNSLMRAKCCRRLASRLAMGRAETTVTCGWVSSPPKLSLLPAAENCACCVPAAPPRQGHLRHLAGSLLGFFALNRRDEQQCHS
jgi:hypothetical protein